MTITQNVKPEVYRCLGSKNIEKINDYINAPMTAVYFQDDKNGNNSSKEAITSEVIYNWMIALNIPMECQKWHLNRLISQIRVVSMKNQPPKKMSQRDMASRRLLNEERKQKMNSKG